MDWLMWPHREALSILRNRSGYINVHEEDISSYTDTWADVFPRQAEEVRMARELQNRVLDLVEAASSIRLVREACPDWLRRPGPGECGDIWPLAQAIYRDLTDADIPDSMPPRERRSIDAVMVLTDGRSVIVEVDEVQHFTPPRARSLALYPNNVLTGFDREVWRRRSEVATKLRGGGFGRPCPPLFPGQGGRHLQRAYRDALADLLPSMHGWGPTLRIGDFEVADWLHADDAVSHMKALLQSKGLETL